MRSYDISKERSQLFLLLLHSFQSIWFVHLVILYLDDSSMLSLHCYRSPRLLISCHSSPLVWISSYFSNCIESKWLFFIVCQFFLYCELCPIVYELSMTDNTNWDGLIYGVQFVFFFKFYFDLIRITKICYHRIELRNVNHQKKKYSPTAFSIPSANILTYILSVLSHF